MSAPTSLAETLAEVMARHRLYVNACGCGWLTTGDYDERAAAFAEHVGEAQAESARAWLVARLNEHGPEVIDSHQFRMLRHGWGCSCGGDYLADHAAHVVAALTEVLTDD